MPAPRLINGNPNTFNPNAASARDVRSGDVVVDLTGAVPGAAVVSGPPGAFTITRVGNAGPQQSTLALTIANPGGAGTARVTATVKDPDSGTPIVGAIVQLALTSPAAMIKGVAGPVGSVGGSVLDGDSATSLLVLGLTGATGVCDFDITGTAAAVIGATAIVLDPLPSSKTAVGAFAP